MEADTRVRFLTGKVLLASPNMLDPRFFEAVIFLCSHSDEGAMGIMINKPAMNFNFTQLIKRLGVPETDTAEEKEIYVGGPVEIERGFVIHSNDYKIPDLTVNIGQCSFTVSVDILKDIFIGRGPKNSIVALGYAGWGPGQLEKEIMDDGWLVSEPDESLIFMKNYENKWNLGIEKLGINLSRLSTCSGNA